MRGTSEVGSAVIASTLTTVAVFFPMVFVEGIAGQMFGDLGLTVVFSPAGVAGGGAVPDPDAGVAHGAGIGGRARAGRLELRGSRRSRMGRTGDR
jgi:hypothetical protein